MMDLRAARRYSQALFELSETRNLTEQMDAALARLSELIEKSPEIASILQSSTIAQAEKEDFLEKFLDSETPRLLIDFIKVLVKKRRFAELSEIQEQFRRRFEQKRGLKEVEAITARTLSDAAEQRLVRVLEKRLGAKIRLKKEVEPKILGGLILRFDGYEINASFRTRLDEMSQALLGIL